MSQNSEVSPMRLLLIEDDPIDSTIYNEIGKMRNDIEFVAMTNSCMQGYDYVKTALPEGVILDLQLVIGEGSGLQFMEKLSNDDSLTLVPLVIITTSNQSKSVHKRLEELGIDWYFSKTSADYSHNLVIDTLLSLRSSLSAKQKNPMFDDRGTFIYSTNKVEIPADREGRVYRRVDTELNNVGIRAKLKGRVYLRDAITHQVMSQNMRGSGIEHTAEKNRLSYSATVKSMQVAINDAWDNHDPVLLKTNFTARITAKTGIPYVSDFVHYFAEKIKNSL